MEEFENALKIFELDENATAQQIKEAYRYLIQAHHPDKFPRNSPARARAEKKSKEINAPKDAGS